MLMSTTHQQLECWLMAALLNIGGALCSPQSLADTH